MSPARCDRGELRLWTLAAALGAAQSGLPTVALRTHLAPAVVVTVGALALAAAAVGSRRRSALTGQTVWALAAHTLAARANDDVGLDYLLAAGVLLLVAISAAGTTTPVRAALRQHLLPAGAALAALPIAVLLTTITLQGTLWFVGGLVAAAGAVSVVLGPSLRQPPPGPPPG